MHAWYSATLLGWSVYLLLWLFVVYCFLGVVIETVYCLVREGVLESRLGLLYLPLRPMYGIGGVASTLLLDPFLQQPIVVFLGGMLICSVVEYAAGSICDKAFGTISWDYRDKLLHLHGRICLQYSVYWGLLVGLTLYVLNPLVSGSVSQLDPRTGEPVLTAVLTLAVASAVLTTAAWTRARRRLDVHRSEAGDRAVTSGGTLIGRVIDRLAPDLLVINTFPRTRLAQELTALTGRQRTWIRWPRLQQIAPTKVTAPTLAATPIPVPLSRGVRPSGGSGHSAGIQQPVRRAVTITADGTGGGVVDHPVPDLLR